MESFKKRTFIKVGSVLLIGAVFVMTSVLLTRTAEAGSLDGSDMFRFDKLTAEPSTIYVGQSTRIEVEVSRKADKPMKKHKPDFAFKCDEWSSHERKVDRDNSREAHTNCTYSKPGVYNVESIVRWESDKGDDYKRTKTVQVTVKAPPPEMSFWADSGSLPYGHRTTLRWSSSNTTQCYVPSGTRWLSGPLPMSGAYTTPRLGGNATYDLTCMGGGGEITRSITLNIAPPPTFPSLKGGQEVKKHTGSEVNVVWAAMNVDWYEVNLSFSPALNGGNVNMAQNFWQRGVDALASLIKKAQAQVAGWTNIRKGWEEFPALDQGNRRLRFVSAGTYRFTITAPGVAAKTLAIDVIPPPSCSMFTGDPLVIPQGGSSLLRWQCNPATIIDGCTISPGVGSVDPDDNGGPNEVNVVPTVTTSYVLNCDGTNMLNPVTITVEKPQRIEVIPTPTR